MPTRALRFLLLSGTAAIASAGTAHAQTTPAGTTISNQAQVSYNVNGTPQTTNSTTASFVVDRKVNFTVETVQTSNTRVNLGDIGAVTTFRVTNTTNSAQDFLLDPDQTMVSLGGLLPGTDNFNMNNLKAFLDDGDGVFNPAKDKATFIDELAPDASVTVFIVADVPNLSGAELSFVSLHVTAAAGGAVGTQGSALIATDLNLLNQDAEVDVVFADNDSDGTAVPGDAPRNGQGRAYAAYEIGDRNVNLTVLKSSRVISDGVSIGNPKALPGALIEYCFVVSNTTLLTAATGVTLTDVIPANTTYVPGSLQVGGVPLAGSCLTGGVAQTDSPGDTTLGGYSGAFNTGTKTVTAVIPTVAGGTSLAASFQVTIN